jgi:hypothetical protein
MNQMMLAILALGMMAAPLQGQNSPPALYAESFRHGSTRITEDSFDVKLTPQNPSYQERIRDAQGKECYEFSVTPLMPGGDDKITSWAVTLKDLRRAFYGNVLVADREASEEAKDNLGWLNPQFTPVPIRAKRIIKVEGFYVVIQVTALHFTPLDSPYLDSMAATFALTNTDPRTNR